MLLGAFSWGGGRIDEKMADAGIASAIFLAGRRKLRTSAGPFRGRPEARRAKLHRALVNRRLGGPRCAPTEEQNDSAEGE
jgi:hypothetical protein